MNMAVLEKALNISKVWFRFSKIAKDGKKMNFRWEELPEHRFEEYIDFRMKYYVKHEFAHDIAGIHKNPKAMKEYRQIISDEFKKPSYYNTICCVDNESSKMVAFDSLQMYRKGDIPDYYRQAQTTELRFFFKLLHLFEDLCPVSDILTKYNVNVIMDDAGTAVHPDFKGYRFMDEIEYLRQTITKVNAVPLAGAWMTSVPVQKTAIRRGWETVYEISCDEFGKILGLKFQNAPPMIMYRIKMIE